MVYHKSRMYYFCEIVKFRPIYTSSSLEINFPVIRSLFGASSNLEFNAYLMVITLTFINLINWNYPTLPAKTDLHHHIMRNCLYLLPSFFLEMSVLGSQQCVCGTYFQDVWFQKIIWQNTSIFFS